MGPDTERDDARSAAPVVDIEVCKRGMLKTWKPSELPIGPLPRTLKLGQMFAAPKISRQISYQKWRWVERTLPGCGRGRRHTALRHDHLRHKKLPRASTANRRHDYCSLLDIAPRSPAGKLKTKQSGEDRCTKVEKSWNESQNS